ncbi:UNVERIFIED_CONTAM: hypothetical protein GTU68_032788 [Idotea baltica]|nr:hypothetical protein [Idotea baltica]
MFTLLLVPKKCSIYLSKFIIFREGNDPADTKKISYKSLLDEVCKVANVLRDRGVKKGDRVALYMPMIPELAGLACCCGKIGAVHSIIVSGFFVTCFSRYLVCKEIIYS